MLEEKLKAADKAYAAGQPIMPDSDYDELVRQTGAPRLMDDTVGVGAPVPHPSIMGSFAKIRTPEEVATFVRKATLANKGSIPGFLIEKKLDGLASNLVYVDGALRYVLTRGNGVLGEDITHNLVAMEGIPRKVNAEGMVEIRGELVVKWTEFNRINKLREEDGEPRYANPRNLAVGIVAQSKSDGIRKVSFVAYGCGDVRPGIVEDQMDLRLWLVQSGFEVADNAIPVRTVHAINQELAELALRRPDLPYLLDGAVIKVSSFGLRQRMGYKDRLPEWAVAFKYPAERAKTKVKAITLQVGRTGAITPVAELEPVFLAGSTVSRCTLHNADDIGRKDVREGSVVEIEKAGEIIPQIATVLSHPEGSAPYDIAAAIAANGWDAVKPDGQTVWRMTEVTPAMRSRRLVHLGSKSVMDIEALGPETADRFIQANYGQHPFEVFLWQPTDYYSVLGSGLYAANLMSGVDAARNRPLHNWIAAAGIQGVGVNTSKLLATRFGSLERMAAVEPSDLWQDEPKPKGGFNRTFLLEGIGQTTADAILAYWRKPENREIVEKLAAAGMKPKQEVVHVKSVEGVAGKVFVVTGALSGMSREDAHAAVIAAGGKTSGSVSKKTSYLVVGDEPGNNKLTAAEKLGVPMLTEEEFLHLLKP